MHQSNLVGLSISPINNRTSYPSMKTRSPKITKKKFTTAVNLPRVLRGVSTRLMLRIYGASHTNKMSQFVSSIPDMNYWAWARRTYPPIPSSRQGGIHHLEHMQVDYGTSMGMVKELIVPGPLVPLATMTQALLQPIPTQRGFDFTLGNKD